MKENEAPEKLYVELCSDGVYAHVREWENSDNIEYTRTDAFIEKATEWLTKHAWKYYHKERLLGTEELVEDFKIVMAL